jgi:hypothetical protein
MLIAAHRQQVERQQPVRRQPQVGTGDTVEPASTFLAQVEHVGCAAA